MGYGVISTGLLDLRACSHFAPNLKTRDAARLALVTLDDPRIELLTRKQSVAY